MTEKKKRLSKAHGVLIIGILAAVALVILTLVLFYGKDADAHKCSPWCFGICPWCWLIVDIIAILIFGIGPIFIIKDKTEETAEEPIKENQPEEQKHPHFHFPHLHLPRIGHSSAHSRHKKVKHGKQYDVTVSLETIMGAFSANERVTLSVLKSKGLVNPKAKGYKVLIQNNETLDRPLTIYASSFSEQAKAAILAAGGKAIKTHV